MHSLDLIAAHIRANSNLDTHRPYVGMSSINGCPRDIYNRYFTGIKPDDADHRRCYKGYMFEREVKHILAACGLFQIGSERELKASWDNRFQGHTEGEDLKGELVEIKSMNAKRYGEIKDTGKLKHPHYWQQQAYMKHGGYRRCTVYIVNSETFEFFIIQIVPNKVLQDKIEDKAASILKAIDAKQMPDCLCGYCR